ncbi:class I SAM-dependent DNA methyltransferase [Klebsiella oxytoca]|uniref:Methyltransferase domain-containing protein n=1 Tax=Klebsiella oxytoca TaxID=571 RepID=A0A6B8MY92_KLEOX|nr:class I SAM-dependent methyltransferase [Klebsiella oxytoca]QGN38048.1 methyltransferase domain-containing protein [Klebsiella oxytoca]
MDHPSAKNIIALYEKQWATFQAQRSTSLFEKPWLDQFLAHLRPGGTILDIGCGNGSPIAEYFLRRGFPVTGVDASPSMIARCRQKFPMGRWLTGDMRELALAERFDGVVAWDSFFHLPRADQRRMFSLFAAHSGDGAALMFNTGTSDGEAVGQFAGEALYHASLAPEEYRNLLRQNAFEVVNHSVEDPQCGGRTVWLAVKRR